ncbi:LysM peptidoglycan-binding domain-containing protein [Clostridium sp. 19966]|uniref:LysM peptidoglycan-binding domain-containing protein n=1 Tax=Clostridium sp. 19966 TaxID=2768166 RepID=UPI0028DD5C43|nr:LysM peptidoglycan-binding domain-containing protein [Clostridium sp. 19966]MDT8718288.1 LysM peptidoglycan-binding domain-containing protein [Clostridium sp. 19966]
MKRKIKIVLVLLFIVVSYTTFSKNTTSKKVYSIKQSKIYTVKKGDTLSEIAQKYKGNEKLTNMINEIKYLNNINDEIYPGEELEIPRGDL